MTITTIIGIVVGILTILGVIWAAVKFVSKVYKKLDTLTEGVMGKPAVKDFSGEVVEKAVPSLQARVSKIEELVIATNEYNERLRKLEEWKIEHQHYTDDVVSKMLAHMDKHDE